MTTEQQSPVLDIDWIDGPINPIDPSAYRDGYVQPMGWLIGPNALESMSVQLIDRGEALGWEPYNRVIEVWQDGEFFLYALATIHPIPTEQEAPRG